MFPGNQQLHQVHAHSSKIYGLLPPLTNLLYLVLAAGAIATGTWLWGGIVTAALTALPSSIGAISAVLGVTLMNFWFARELQTWILNLKEVEPTTDFANDGINLRSVFKLTNHIVNAHYAKQYGSRHVNLAVGRLGVFEAKDQGHKLVGVQGRNGANAVYAISQKVLDKDSAMKPKHIAVWLLKEQIKSYHNRGWAGLLVSIFESLNSTISSLQVSNSMLNRLLWLATTPLQLVLLVPKLIKRSHEFDAWRETIKMGYGFEAIEHLDIKSNRNRVTRPEPWEIIRRKAKHFAKRKPYNGFMAFIIRPITNRIDSYLEKNEWAYDDKNDWRLTTLANALFLNFGRWVQELFAETPNGYNIKEVLKNDIPGLSAANKTLKDELVAAYGKPAEKDRKRAETKAIDNYKTRYEQIKAEQTSLQQKFKADNHQRLNKIIAKPKCAQHKSNKRAAQQALLFGYNRPEAIEVSPASPRRTRSRVARVA